MKSLVEKLRHHQLARAKAIISLSNLQAIQGIPKGCTVNAELGIANPPETLIRAWEATLSQCGQTLSQLLKDHHSRTIDLHSDQVDTISDDLGDLVDNFNTTIPDFADKVDQIVMEIRAQADRIIASRSTIMKRTLKDDNQQGPKQKKPKNFTKPRPPNPSYHHRPRGR